MRTGGGGKKALGADERRTDDDRVVVSDEHLAVHVDELRDQASLQLGVSAQAGEGDVVHPLIVHCGRAKHRPASGETRCPRAVSRAARVDLLSFFSWEMMECSPRIMVLRTQQNPVRLSPPSSFPQPTHESPVVEVHDGLDGVPSPRGDVPFEAGEQGCDDVHAVLPALPVDTRIKTDDSQTPDMFHSKTRSQVGRACALG